MLPVFLYAAVSSAAVALLLPLSPLCAKWPASSAAVCATVVPQLLETQFLLLLMHP